jgi:hypothetical protein
VIAGVCGGHGGGAPRGVCAVTIEQGKPIVWTCDEQGAFLRNPRAATKTGVVWLAKRGAVRWGFFNRWAPTRFLRRLERVGVKVELVRMGLVRAYRFEPQKGGAG